MQSESFRPLLHPANEATRECARTEWNTNPDRYGVDLKLRMVRTKRYKATFELNTNAGEMYDLQEDPGELHNLFDDPDYREIRDELEEMMRARPGPELAKKPEPVGYT